MLGERDGEGEREKCMKALTFEEATKKINYPLTIFRIIYRLLKDS